MPSSLLLPLLFLLFPAVATDNCSVPPGAAIPALRDSVHDGLSEYGLPRGILPAAVGRFRMSKNGEFVLGLTARCYVRFAAASLVFYDRTIRGRISHGAVTGLTGVKVRKFFAWFPVTSVAVDAEGGVLELQVGFFSEKLPLSLFDRVPSCRRRRSRNSLAAFSRDVA